MIKRELSVQVIKKNPRRDPNYAFILGAAVYMVAKNYSEQYECSISARDNYEQYENLISARGL